MVTKGDWGPNKRTGRIQTNTFENIEKILKNKTFIDPISDCWIWEGAKNRKGYGHIRMDGKTVNIPRISAFLYLNLNQNDSATHVLHKCPNKACWNPNHLYLGDNIDNWKDRKEGSEVFNLLREPRNKETE